MTMRILAYNVLLFACFLYAMARGGAPERIGATVLLVGSLLTRALHYTRQDFVSLEPALFAIDVAGFLAFLGLALAAERFWPICVTGLQGAALMSHIPVTLDDRNVAFAYAAVLALWAYPMLVLIIIATARHRQRLRRTGSDRSWKPSLARWARPSRKTRPNG